jgi:adenylate kinase
MIIRFKQNAPRRPPRIILLGPPGSGRTTQAEILSHRFGLALVSPQKLLEEESKRSPGIKIKVDQAREAGEHVEEDLVLRLVAERMMQSDCRINGWILDGFPETET